MFMQIFFILQVQLLDTRFVIIHRKVCSRCALGALSLCITLVSGEYWTRIRF